MFLGKKIASSSIAEVVIALSVIALCIGVASLVFVRSTKTSMNFHDVRKQTEIQSRIWNQLLSTEDQEEWGEMEFSTEADQYNESLEVYQFNGMNDREIWVQQWIKK